MTAEFMIVGGLFAVVATVAGWGNTCFSAKSIAVFVVSNLIGLAIIWNMLSYTNEKHRHDHDREPQIARSWR